MYCFFLPKYVFQNFNLFLFFIFYLFIYIYIYFFLIFYFNFLLESESSEIYTHYLCYEKLVKSFWIKMFKNKAKIAPEST